MRRTLSPYAALRTSNIGPAVGRDKASGCTSITMRLDSTYALRAAARRVRIAEFGSALALERPENGNGAAVSGTTQMAVMVFGALLALIGIFLFTRSKVQGENRISVLGFTAELSTPSLVVFVVGCLIFVSPFLLGDEKKGDEPAGPDSGTPPLRVLKLLELECRQAQPGLGGTRSSFFEDEPVVVVNGERLWSGKMKTGDREPLDDYSAPLTSDGTATVELLELDKRKTESLGKHTVSADREPSPLHFTEGKAHYVLTYEIQGG